MVKIIALYYYTAHLMLNPCEFLEMFDKNYAGVIKEMFLGYLVVTGDTTGAGLADIISQYIEEDLKLSMDKLRGQCYDGAGNQLS